MISFLFFFCIHRHLVPTPVELLEWNGMEWNLIYPPGKEPTESMNKTLAIHIHWSFTYRQTNRNCSARFSHVLIVQGFPLA